MYRMKICRSISFCWIKLKYPPSERRWVSPIGWKPTLAVPKNKPFTVRFQMKRIGDPNERPIFLPLFEVIINHVLQRKIMRQKFPLDSGTIPIQNRVDDFSQVDGNFFPVCFGGGNIGRIKSIAPRACPFCTLCGACHSFELWIPLMNFYAKHNILLTYFKYQFQNRLSVSKWTNIFQYLDYYL